MLDQAGPGPPCAGPLGPAYVRAWRRYLPQGSAWAGLPAGEEARGKGGRGAPQVRRGLQRRGGRDVTAVSSMYLFKALNSLG